MIRSCAEVLDRKSSQEHVALKHLKHVRVELRVTCHTRKKWRISVGFERLKHVQHLKHVIFA